MKARPILYSAPMARAKVERRKTQTRRIIKPQPVLSEKVGFIFKGYAYGLGGSFDPKGLRNLNCRCPYGKPGDLLWGKETYSANSTEIIYRATHYGPPIGGKWRPSIFMPHWASRIHDEIVDVRVERLQDITEADAIAEGIYEVWPGRFHWQETAFCTAKTAVESYFELWEMINGPGSVELNPWVWVIKTKAVKL